MKLIVIAFVLVAAPVAAQSRLYTNADARKPLTWSHTISEDEYRAFASNQFTLPQTFKGQTVVIVPSSRLAFDGPSTPIQHDAATSAIFYPKFLYGLISPWAGDDRRLIQPVVPSVPRQVVPPAERLPRLATVIPSIPRS